MATPSQAEIVLRAISYSTGELWESVKTPVLSCAWIFAYPWLTGKVNHMVTGMGFGSKARQALPEGWMLISIPWDKIPVMIRSLEKMTWDLPAYSEGREKFMEREARVREEGARGRRGDMRPAREDRPRVWRRAPCSCLAARRRAGAAAMTGCVTSDRPRSAGHRPTDEHHRGLTGATVTETSSLRSRRSAGPSDRHTPPRPVCAERAHDHLSSPAPPSRRWQPLAHVRGPHDRRDSGSPCATSVIDAGGDGQKVLDGWQGR